MDGKSRVYVIHIIKAINIIHMLFEIGPGVTQRPFRIEKLAWIAAHF